MHNVHTHSIPSTHLLSPLRAPRGLGVSVIWQHFLSKCIMTCKDVPSSHIKRAETHPRVGAYINTQGNKQTLAQTHVQLLHYTVEWMRCRSVCRRGEEAGSLLVLVNQAEAQRPPVWSGSAESGGPVGATNSRPERNIIRLRK